MCLRLCDLYDADRSQYDPDVQRLRRSLPVGLLPQVPQDSPGRAALREHRAALRPAGGAV